MKKVTSLIASGLGVALSLAAFPGSAAATTHYVPAAQCTKHSGGGTPNYWYSGIYNDASSGDLIVKCPLESFGTGSVSGIKFRGLQPNSDAQVSCTAYRSESAYPYLYYTTSTNHTGGASVYNQEITLSSLSGSYSTRSFFMDCRIPPMKYGNRSGVDRVQFTQ